MRLFSIFTESVNIIKENIKNVLHKTGISHFYSITVEQNNMKKISTDTFVGNVENKRSNFQRKTKNHTTAKNKA